MKLKDYTLDLIKKEIKNILDPHDTNYGAFCKGMDFAERVKQISPEDKMPEDFEDLLVANDSCTKKVLVVYESGGFALKARIKVDNGWDWNTAPSQKIVSWSYVTLEP